MHRFSINSSTARGHRKFHAWIIFLFNFNQKFCIYISALFCLLKIKKFKRSFNINRDHGKKDKNKHKNLSLLFTMRRTK